MWSFVVVLNRSLAEVPSFTRARFVENTQHRNLYFKTSNCSNFDTI